MIKVLIVEDETTMTRVIQDNLVTEGFEVLTARDGQEGLDLLKKDTFDVILLDISMPNVDGIDMMHQLRNDGEGRDTPIIIYTNLVPDDSILKGVSEDKPAYYFSKTTHSVPDVILKIREIAGE